MSDRDHTVILTTWKAGTGKLRSWKTGLCFFRPGLGRGPQGGRRQTAIRYRILFWADKTCIGIDQGVGLLLLLTCKFQILNFWQDFFLTFLNNLTNFPSQNQLQFVIPMHRNPQFDSPCSRCLYLSLYFIYPALWFFLQSLGNCHCSTFLLWLLRANVFHLWGSTHFKYSNLFSTLYFTIAKKLLSIVYTPPTPAQL